MANTVIALKKSAIPLSVPSNLANGELAINYADGKLYYRAANGTIASISGNEPNYFGTVNASGTFVVADTPGDILTLVSGNNISIVGDVIYDSVRIGLTNDVNIPGKMNVAGDFTHTGGSFYVNNMSGAGGSSEGGEIKLANATQNQVLSGPVSIDIYENKLRFFETNSPNRGAFINIAFAAAGVGTDLLATAGSSTDATARDWAASAFGKANAALPNTSGATFNGSLTVSADLSADRVLSTNNGNGENFKVGDDAWLGDTNLANAVRLKGQQNTSHGYILFGPNDGKLLGRAGTDNLTYDGNTVWHAGIDGAGSGLDADLLDGQHGTFYGTATNVSAAFTRANSALPNTSGTVFNGELFIPTLLVGSTTPNIARLRLLQDGNVSYIQSGTDALFSARPIHFTPYYSASATMVIDIANNAVGIGRSDPGYALDVNGTINASSVLIRGQSILATLDGANSITVSAFAQANTARNHANAAHLTANAGFDQANTVRDHANAAFAAANSKFSSSGGTITGDVNIVGNLTMSGNTAFINVSSYRVDDPLIYLAANNYSSDLVDIGFIANYVNATGQNVHTGLYREHENKMYYLFQGYDQEPINNHIGAMSNNMTLAVLNADLATSNLLLAGTNTVIWIRSSYDQANTARDHANISFSQANTARDHANVAYDQANTARSHANAAHLTANAGYDQANTARNQANLSFSQANTAGSIASAAFDKANTSTGGSYYSGNNGDVGNATGLGDIFRVHTNVLTANTTIYSGNNALAAGPITVASGRTLTIQSNARVSIV